MYNKHKKSLLYLKLEPQNVIILYKFIYEELLYNNKCLITND